MLPLRYPCSLYEEELAYGPDNYLRYSAVAREGEPVPLATVRILASHFASPYLVSSSRIPFYISTTLHIILPNPAELRKLGVHQDPSHSIYSHNFSNSNHKKRTSFIPHPTSHSEPASQQGKNSQSKTAEPAKQTLPRSSPLPCMHNTFSPPNPSTQLPEPPPHL